MIMAKQKQGGGKARKGASKRAHTNGSDRASQKQSVDYLRGPKDGGPTLAERVAGYNRRVAQEERDRFKRPKLNSWW